MGEDGEGRILGGMRRVFGIQKDCHETAHIKGTGCLPVPFIRKFLSQTNML
jgi:hypothetical protein